MRFWNVNVHYAQRSSFSFSKLELSNRLLNRQCWLKPSALCTSTARTSCDIPESDPENKYTWNKFSDFFIAALRGSGGCELRAFGRFDTAVCLGDFTARPLLPHDCRKHMGERVKGAEPNSSYSNCRRQENTFVRGACHHAWIGSRCHGTRHVEVISLSLLHHMENKPFASTIGNTHGFPGVNVFHSSVLKAVYVTMEPFCWRLCIHNE